MRAGFLLSGTETAPGSTGETRLGSAAWSNKTWEKRALIARASAPASSLSIGSWRWRCSRGDHRRVGAGRLPDSDATLPKAVQVRAIVRRIVARRSPMLSALPISLQFAEWDRQFRCTDHPSLLASPRQGCASDARLSSAPKRSAHKRHRGARALGTSAASASASLARPSVHSIARRYRVLLAQRRA
jgi:hypothetical protein